MFSMVMSHIQPLNWNLQRQENEPEVYKRFFGNAFDDPMGSKVLNDIHSISSNIYKLYRLRAFNRQIVTI
jgi:hypothetical protein